MLTSEGIHWTVCTNVLQFSKEVTCNNVTMMSLWARWRLTSPASRVFTQPSVQAQIKEITKAPRHWPLWGNSPVTGEFPSKRASNAEKVSIWWRQHEFSWHAATGVYLNQCVAAWFPGPPYIKGNQVPIIRCHKSYYDKCNWFDSQVRWS